MMWKNGLFTMWFQDFANSLLSELQLPNKPLPRKKPTAETFSDTPLPDIIQWMMVHSMSNQASTAVTCWMF